MSVTTDFNPNVAVGFPGLVLQESMGPRFGEIASVTHTLINDAGGTTAVQMSYARQDDVITVNGRPSGPVLRNAPLWINKAYLPEFVDREEFSADRRDPDSDETESLERGPGAWRHFFGNSGRAFWSSIPLATNSETANRELKLAQQAQRDRDRGEEESEAASELEDLQHGGRFGFSQRTAADALLAHYKSLDDESRQDFIDTYTNRRVATLADLAQWEGFTIVSPAVPGGDVDQLEGTTFRATPRAVVERIRTGSEEDDFDGLIESQAFRA